MFAILLAVGVTSTAVQAQCQYEVTVIYAPGCPPPFPPPPIIGRAINDLGHVAGYYNQCGGAAGKEAFVWRPETGVQTLQRPGGVSSALATDINDAGQIVGTMTTTEYGFVAFVYEQGAWTVLPPLPGGAWSGAGSVNEAGQVAGFRSIGSKADPVNPLNAFIWSQSRGFLDLGVMSGPNSSATDITDDGRVVGWTGNGGPVSEAFLWEAGTTALLGPVPGGFTSTAGGINNIGIVAGSGRVQERPGGPVATLGFVWDSGQMTLIDPIPGYGTSGAADINDAGQVTGLSVKLSDPNDRRAFVWYDGVTYDLNELVPPGSGIIIQRAKAINDAGQIVADGHSLTGLVVTFVLTPPDIGPGDINIDCRVDAADLMILIDHFAQIHAPADLNNDGIVNVLDLIILLLNFGSSS